MRVAAPSPGPFFSPTAELGLARPTPLCAVLGWTGNLPEKARARQETLAAIDAEIAAVLAALHERPGFAQESWLVVLAAPAPAGGAASAPIARRTRDSALRVPTVPLLFRGERFAPGEIGVHVQLSDVFPTLAAHLGLRPGLGWLLDGAALSLEPARLDANLLGNAGAEAQVGWRFETGKRLVPGWRCDGTSAVAPYQERGLPRAAPGPPGRGRNHFRGGAQRAGSMEQLVDLSALAAEIDQGRVLARLSAWLGGTEEGQQAGLELALLDAVGKGLAEARLGPVGACERREELGSDQGVARAGLVRRELELALPRRTRRARVTLAFEGPSACDRACADELELRLVLR